MNQWIKNLALLALMLVTSAGAIALRPVHKTADQGPKVDLEAMVPLRFGEWRLAPQQPQVIINPVQEETLKRVYDQILTRTYIGPDNYSIMLSIAYGKNQNSGEALAVHYPEVCYPAQGFDVISNAMGSINTPYKSIPVRRLETQLGAQRAEPVTYWITTGEFITLGGIDRRLIELKYGLKGMLPDGFLFRVSSVDANSANAFSMQEQFINALLASLSDRDRVRLAGSDHK